MSKHTQGVSLKSKCTIWPLNMEAAQGGRWLDHMEEGRRVRALGLVL